MLESIPNSNLGKVASAVPWLLARMYDLGTVTTLSVARTRSLPSLSLVLRCTVKKSLKLETPKKKYL